jgi:predicted  nucleic acid-binding Zn-ribbon protein
MTGSSQNESLLQQLLALHDIDQQIVDIEREVRDCKNQLEVVEDGVAGMDAELQRLETELEQARHNARAVERAVDEKRDALTRVRQRTDQVQNERQYSAATLEFDLVRQDLRKLEDRAIEKLQTVEELEKLCQEKLASLEGARTDAGPLGQELRQRVKQLEGELAVKHDRRNNAAIRIDERALGLYERVRGGRSQMAMAPLTDESVCGYCFTSVTSMQEMQIRGMSSLICCEGCGVILYPGDVKR